MRVLYSHDPNVLTDLDFYLPNVHNRGHYQNSVFFADPSQYLYYHITFDEFIPLILGGGLFWPPLAVSIGGGVGGATILALIFVPAFYVLTMCPKKDRGYSTVKQSLNIRAEVVA